MSHSRQTEHYGLPLYDGTDIINPLTDFNNANEAIDEAVYNANQRSVQAETTAEEAKDIAEGYDARVTQAIETANSAMTLANNTQDMIAEDFDPMKEGGYQVGDFVIYNGVLYRFINAHTGAWDASDVQASPVLIDAIADVVDEGKQAIEEAVEEAEEEIAGQTEKVTKTQAMIAQPFDENKVGGYAVDDIVTYADKLYKFTSAHSGTWTGLDVEQVDVISNENEKIADLNSVLSTIGIASFLNITANISVLLESSPNEGLKFTVPKGKWIIIAQIGWNADAGSQFVQIADVINMVVNTGQSCCGVGYLNINADTNYYVVAKTQAFTGNLISVVGIRVG